MSINEEQSVPQPKTQLEELVGTVAPEQDTGPAYRIFKDTKIPVGKGVGKLWRGRWESGKKHKEVLSVGCDEALRYYNNNQLQHRVAREGASGNTFASRRVSPLWSETENVIYSTVNSIVDMTYAKNPDVNVTAEDDRHKPLARTVERLLRTLANLNSAPGLAMKPKVKQAIIHGHVTNIAWLQVGYTRREVSSDQAMNDLIKIGEQYATEKDAKKIKELEGQLMALEDAALFLDPEGPTLKFLPHDAVISDPDSVDPLYLDAQWHMIKTLLPTAYLNARFGEKNEDGSVKSVYEPSVVLLGTDNKGIDETVNNFSLFSKESTPATYGYQTQRELDMACRTEVYMVWDKVTRRVLMFDSKKWDWPIWVWDDPYQLPNFFPIFPLCFNLAPVGPVGMSPVAYVLDQQDAINEINDEERRARQQIKSNLLFNSNTISKDDVEAVLKGPDGTARGVKVPEGQKLDDCFAAPPMPILKAPQLFNKEPKIAAMDRILGSNEIVRGGQFKTNTTNGQVDVYNSISNTKLDSKIDTIEDCLSEVFRAVMILCLRFMSKDKVAELIGQQHAAAWENMPPSEARLLSLRCVGGSTQKPTSTQKKQETIQFGQMLGQFAKAAPATVIKILLKLAENSFDELHITPEEWEQLNAEAMRNAEGGGAGSQAGGGPSMEQVAAMIDQLPPQAKQALGVAIARGVPIAEAIPQIMELLRGTQQQAQPN